MTMSGNGNAWAGVGDEPSTSGNSGNGMNPWAAGAAGGGIAALLANLFKGSPNFTNPASGAQSYLDRIPETLRPYFQSYINRGQNAGNTLDTQYNSMTSDPSGFLANIGKNYSQSPGYKFRVGQALQGSNNAAAAGGMLGSGAHQQENATVSEGLANQDYEGWLNHALNIFGMGQQGLQGEENQGYGASTDYGTSLANALMSQADLSYRGTEDQNKYNQAQSNANSDMWGTIGGAAAKAIPFLAGL
jgi:hypothetical protein